MVNGASLRAGREAGTSPLLIALLALAAAALSFAASIGLARISLGSLGAVAGTAVCLWLVSSERYELTLAVLVMMAALPVGTNALLFAQRYAVLEAEATAAIVASTFAFVATAGLWLTVLAAFTTLS